MATLDISDDLSHSPFQSKSPEQQIRSNNDAEDELDFEEGEEDSQDNTQKSIKPCITVDNEPGDVPSKPHGRGGDDGGEEGQVDSDEDLEEGELKEDDDDDGLTDQVPPKEVCKYYHKGQCTWGEGCRFLHEEPLAPALLPRPSGPRVSQPMHLLKAPLISAPRPPRDFYPPPPLLPLPGPPVPPPSDPLWDRAPRTSSKDRQSLDRKSKSRSDYTDGYPDKRSNSNYRDSNYSHSNYYSGSSSGAGASSSGTGRHHYPSSSSTPSHLPSSQSSSSSYRDSYYKSPSPRRHQYSTSTSSHHHPRDYDVSEYERRRRQAVEVAPRPDEWEKSDRYGRDIETRHGHYSAASASYGRNRKTTPADADWVDKWQPRPAERGSNLSSISSSDSPARLSRNLSDSDSTGSWSDLSDKGNKEHTKRTNYRTRPSSSSVAGGPNVNVDPTRRSTTAGMKRIPKLSERNRHKPPSDDVCDLAPYDDSHAHDNHEDRPSRLSLDGDKTHEGSVSRSSLSSGSALDDIPRKHRHSSTYISSDGYKSHNDTNTHESKRSYNSESESFGTKRVRTDLDETSSHSSNALSPAQAHKEKFVMDFVGKQPRIKPTSVLESKSTDDDDSSPESPLQRSQSSDVPSSESSTGGGGGGADKSIERQKLLEQLKAVEAAINAKKGKSTKSSGPKKRV